MATFRTLSAADVRAILDGYEALGAASYRAHAAVAAGAINTNVRVETTAGTYFLRINEGKTRDDVEREAAIVAHAAARGVPTPAPLRTRPSEASGVGAGRVGADVPEGPPSGAPFAEWRGERASLFPWVPGHVLTRAQLTPAHAALVGRALASLHLASGGFSDQRAGRYEPDEIRRRCDHVAGLGRSELVGAIAVLDLALRELERERAAPLPLGLIHGDLFIDNVLYEGEPGAEPRLSALIDFEQASWGRFAYDLAVTTLAFGYGRDDFRADVTRALLDAYAAARPTTAAERAAFGAELRFAACRFAITRITDVHLKRDAGAPRGKDFTRYLARLASVEVHLATGDGLLTLP